MIGAGDFVPEPGELFKRINKFVAKFPTLYIVYTSEVKSIYPVIDILLDSFPVVACRHFCKGFVSSEMTSTNSVIVASFKDLTFHLVFSHNLLNSLLALVVENSMYNLEVFGSLPDYTLLLLAASRWVLAH